MAPLLTLEAGHTDPLLEPGPHQRLGITRTRGPVRARTGRALAWVLVEGGEGQLRAGDDAVDVHARGDVFDGPGWSAIVGPGDELTIDGEVAATPTPSTPASIPGSRDG